MYFFMYSKLLFLTSFESLEGGYKVTGDYKVTITANSDQLTDKEELRITVETGSSTTYLGIGIIVGSLIILGLVLKRYGRK